METRKEIVEFIELKTGERVPESRIVNYHKHGVIPSPVRRFGEKTGSLPSEYPDGTKEQAWHVYTELKNNKDFECILGESFLERRPVSIEHLKKMLLNNLNLERVKNEFKSLLLKFLAPQDIDMAFSRIQKYGPHVRADSKESDIWYLFLEQLIRDVTLKYVTNNRSAHINDNENFISLCGDILFNHFPTFTHTTHSEGMSHSETHSVIESDNDDNKTSFCKITGLPNDSSVSNGLLTQLAKIFKIKSIIATILQITGTQLETARDDYITIRDNIHYIETYILRPNGFSVIDKPFFIHIYSEISDPTTQLFAMIVILLSIMRGYYEPIITLTIQQMSGEQRKEVIDKFNKLPPNIKSIFNALIANSQVKKSNSLLKESNP
jgi:hypothetical protein